MGFIVSLAFIFLLNSIGGGLFAGESWAAKISSGLTSVGPEKTGGPTPLKNLNPDTFTLPQELGYIQESEKAPNSSKTVIHIQDAHCNYAAQKSISKVLNYLTKEYGINMVNCEGAAEGYDLSVFTDIPEKDIREKTSDFFVKEGVVSAAEFFAVNNPKEVKLWGVEDADLYIKNLKVYRDSLAHKGEVDRYIKSIGYILDNLKRHIYPAQVLEFDDYYTRYKAEKITFKEYMKYLIMTAQKSLIDIKSFSDIYLLSQALEQEEKIDFKKANNEKDEVVGKLKKVLSRNELEELMTKVGQLKTEKISQADFYAYLIKKAKAIKIDLGAYPELRKYVIYVSLYSAVDKTKVAEEIESLEDRIKETLYENDTQRELGILSKNLVLTNNMFNISLTREDYAYYVKHTAAFSVSNYEKFIEKEAPLYKIRAALDENIGRLDIYREGMEKFYQCSLERDKAFVKNIKFTDHDRPSSIIITGGFHTQNLRELFKNENVSYISIMPKFASPPGYESPYLKRLAGQRTALENVIDTAIPAVLNLAVVEILSTRLAREVEGISNIQKFRIAVAVIAAINRGEKFLLSIKVPPQAGKSEEKKFITFAKGEGAEPVKVEMAQTAPTGLKINASLVPEEGTAALKLVMQPKQVVETPAAQARLIPQEESKTVATASQNMQILTNNWRQGVFNIFIMKAAQETIAGQTTIGREASNVFEKKFGIDTIVLYYTDSQGLKTQLGHMQQLIGENEGKSPMAFVNCMSKEDLDTVKAFLEQSPALQDIVAKGKDFKEGEKERGIPDEIRIMIAGTDIMNDRRLSKAPSTKPEDLYESRMQTLSVLNTNGIIDDADFDTVRKLTLAGAEELNKFMEKIWQGSISLRCTKVDWEKVEDWKRSQRQLLQSV